MVSVLRSEHLVDRVQTLGECVGMEGSEKASAEAFKALHKAQEGGKEAKVASLLPAVHARAWLLKAHSVQS